MKAVLIAALLTVCSLSGCTTVGLGSSMVVSEPNCKAIREEEGGFMGYWDGLRCQNAAYRTQVAIIDQAQQQFNAVAWQWYRMGYDGTNYTVGPFPERYAGCGTAPTPQFRNACLRGIDEALASKVPSQISQGYFRRAQAIEAVGAAGVLTPRGTGTSTGGGWVQFTPGGGF